MVWSTDLLQGPHKCSLGLHSGEFSETQNINALPTKGFSLVAIG